MSAPTISWANLCRQSQGEKLIEVRGRLETKCQGNYLKKAFRILDLPFPEREQVLINLLEDDTLTVFLPGFNGRSRPTPIRLPALARVGNRQLRLEMIRVVLMNTTIEIHSGPGNDKLQNWLASINFMKSKRQVETSFITGFDAVKRLRFPYFSRFPFRYLVPEAPNNDIELMRKCKNLAQVSVNFVSSELLWKTPAVLCRQYRLKSMLELKELEVLNFQGVWGEEETVLMTALKEWFEQEYGKKKEKGERKKNVRILLNGA